MAEDLNTSPNQKPDYSYISNPLTPAEVESLRQDTKEAFRILEELSEKKYQKEHSGNKATKS